MSRAGEFEELRPLLSAIAYRILGSVSEAEDAVQETWLRYAASPANPASVRAFLAAMVTRVSIDVLLLERLTPLERAVFVLREVFGFGFGEVAALARSIIGAENVARVLASFFPWLGEAHSLPDLRGCPRPRLVTAVAGNAPGTPSAPP